MLERLEEKGKDWQVAAKNLVGALSQRRPGSGGGDDPLGALEEADAR
jgi:hypothetical protein